MTKTILITGATDGIGLETAKRLAAKGHRLLLHGRSAQKLEAAQQTVSSQKGAGPCETYKADLSLLDEVVALARQIKEQRNRLDVLINNAGVFKVREPLGPGGLDIRFIVNTLAPYLLTKELHSSMNDGARVINLSSAAQSAINLDAITGQIRLTEMDAYAQSKLALTLWTTFLAAQGKEGPLYVAVNPGSLLASKMVKDGFGIAGKDLGIGADILVRAALSDEFRDANGLYFDNDSDQFTKPHPDAMNFSKGKRLLAVMESLLP